jgi:hypothetical protein
LAAAVLNDDRHVLNSVKYARREDMNRDALIPELRRYGRKAGLAFDVDARKGKGGTRRFRSGSSSPPSKAAS